MDGGGASILGDEASSADGIVYGGCEHPVSALAEYILNTINLGLDPGSKVTWDDVIIRTPWMTKRLHTMTAAQEVMVRRQALPVPGESLELEVTLEKMYSEQVLHSKGRGKLVTSSGLTKIGRGDSLKLHLKRAARGEGWSVEMKDSGLTVGHPSPANQETGKPEESE